MAITLQEFQQRINDRFPDKDYRVLKFDGLKYPVTILCPIHGKQRLSTAHNLINSRQGCPECGKEAAASHAAKRMTEKHSGRARLLEALYSIPGSLSDAEFRHRATEIINALKRGNYL